MQNQIASNMSQGLDNEIELLKKRIGDLKRKV